MRNLDRIKALPDSLRAWVSENFYPLMQGTLLDEFSILSDKASWPIPESLSNYARKGRFMKSHSRGLSDYANVPKSFFAMKTAMKWNCRMKFHEDFFLKLWDVVENSDTSAGSVFATEEWEEKFVNACNVHAKNIIDIDGQRREFYVDESLPPRKSESKLHSLRLLPAGWLDTLWQMVIKDSQKFDHLVNQPFEEIFAALALVAPRPKEFQRDNLNACRNDDEIIKRICADKTTIQMGDGVLIQYRSSQNDLVFTVAGGKLDESEGKGQAWRRIVVAIQNAQAEFLRDRIVENDGKPLLLGLPEYKKLTRWIRNISEKAFPDIGPKSHVTCYTFRHALCSEMKAAGWSQAKIAMVLGQQSARTQENYGRARFSRDKCSIVDVEAASKIRPSRKKDFAQIRKDKKVTALAIR